MLFRSRITAYDEDDDEEDKDVFIGDFAEQYLRVFATVFAADGHLDCGIRMVGFTLGTREQK